MPPDRHLLVDAYNIIHAWPDLRAALLEHGPEPARAKLSAALRPIHDSEGWRVTIVFDGSGDDTVVERPSQELTFSYVYGPRGLSADAIIEQLVVNATLHPDEDRRPRKKRREEPEIVVATRDNLLSAAAAAAGARLMTPDFLRDWAENAAARQTRDVLAHSRRSANKWQTGTSPWDKLVEAKSPKRLPPKHDV